MSNKQEEVDRILTKYTGRTGGHLTIVLKELSEAGVVLKVEGELPKWVYHWAAETGYYLAQQDMLKAGYVLTAPLRETPATSAESEVKE